MMNIKHLSSIANDVVQRCAQCSGTSIDLLVEEFEAEWKPEVGVYSKKFIEFCSSKALTNVCRNIGERISDGSFNRLTFDMMLAWEKPSATDEAYSESSAKEKEDKEPTKVVGAQDDVSLFYSDIMPLLVDNEPGVGEDSFVWLGSIVPLVTDFVNGRFTFESLTAPTGYKFHFPAYDLFIKEIDNCIKHLQKQAKPKGVELDDDEFILHVEGTASTQRVVRHIGGTSWPGRLTLTNYALYFEASGVISYEDAIKIDLSEKIDHSVKAAATGPWGAPLFDKAILYESPELSEGIILEFPEITSSTRRDHWLSLVKEVILMHQFLSKFNVTCPMQAWEMHARTMLGMIRLHAAREMLRISPPDPKKFLIFTLFEELPKGDFVLEELAESLKAVNSGHPCSATTLLRSMNVSHMIVTSLEVEKNGKESSRSFLEKDANYSSLETAVEQTRGEAKEIAVAKATTEGIKQEGISESAVVLMELVKPLKSALPWAQDIVSWRKPINTLGVLVLTLLIVYQEWIGKALAGCLFWIIGKMLQARKERLKEKCDEIIVSTASDQSTRESIISAQFGLITIHQMMQDATIGILKIWSIYISKAHKQANIVMLAMGGAGIILVAIPFKVIIMSCVLYLFITESSAMKNMSRKQGGDRRWKEWWNSIPIINVRVVDQKIEDRPQIK